MKIRGYRINLREVEEAVLKHPEVAAVAVVDRVADDATRYLAAVVETTEGAELSLRALKRHLSESLPAYMAPETLEIVTELPKTSTGKVDRQALKAATDLEPVHP
ncbi:MAG: hypothetical protein HPM95_02730 [Alphaproteobacteria bacterium]|nr:hypothetical protein [Alphaproteobacteria bacterium]